MSKKEMLSTFDNSSYTALIAGALFVLIFEFTANLVVFRIAIILFAAAFLIFCLLVSLKLYYIKIELKENDVLVVDKSKESKKWLIVRLVLSSIAFVTMIIFLCLF